jgi:hypothetical protein
MECTTCQHTRRADVHCKECDEWYCQPCYDERVAKRPALYEHPHVVLEDEHDLGLHPEPVMFCPDCEEA